MIHPVRLTAENRKRAKARLNEIATELETAFTRVREAQASVQRLRDEQRDLNAQVYKP